MVKKFLLKKETETVLWIIFYSYFAAMVLLVLISYENQVVYNFFVTMCVLMLFLILKRYLMLKEADVTWVICSQRLPESSGYYVTKDIRPSGGGIYSTVYYFDTCKKQFYVASEKYIEVYPLKWLSLNDYKSQ